MEGEPRGYAEKPRMGEATIEGKLETSFREIDVDQATHVPLPRHINWPTARLSFQEVGNYLIQERFGISSTARLYAGQLEYRGRNGRKTTSNLSLTTSKDKPVLFTGTTDGFYAYDPLMNGKQDPFYLVGIQIPELGENMSKLSAIWHELGHIALYYTNADTQLLKAAISLQARDLPRIAKAKEYGTYLARAISDNRRKNLPPISRPVLGQLRADNYQANKVIRLFHERNAWAAGINLVRDHGYPTGFHNPLSYFDYARLCLSTYARSYSDEKFIKGWKK